jgi:NitT/TauT family transport system substrate-binding protein
LDIISDIFLANDYVILQDKTSDKLNLFKLADVDFDPVGHLLTVNGSVLDSNKALVHSFTQATLKGLQYTLDHPDEATQIMVKLYSDQMGPNVIEGEVKNLLPLINRAPSLGNSDPAAWDKTLVMLRDAGVIDKKLANDQYYTNEFVA